MSAATREGWHVMAQIMAALLCLSLIPMLVAGALVAWVSSTREVVVVERDGKVTSPMGAPDLGRLR